MGTDANPQALRQRLARVKNLARRAGTDGERQAALAAAERIEARLAAPGSTIAPDPFLDPPDGRWPDRNELRVRVEAWGKGQLDGDKLAIWAQDRIDQCLLPDVPVSDPVGIEVEVLLQLSTLHLGVLLPERDAPALQAFLDTPRMDTSLGWQAWFRHVRGASAPSLRGGSTDPT